MEFLIAIIIAIPVFILGSMLMSYVGGVSYKKLSQLERNLMFLPPLVLFGVGVFAAIFIAIWAMLFFLAALAWVFSLGVYYMKTKPNIWDVGDEDRVKPDVQLGLLARVTISIKPTVNDPQGLTIAKALRESLGFTEVEEVRAGKSILIRLNSEDLDQARERVEVMCKRLLANPVIETYSFEIEPVDDRS